MKPERKPQNTKDLSRAKKLRVLSRLMRESIFASSCPRRAAHPALAARVGAELARSPKRGLVEQLMFEMRGAFKKGDYAGAIVKSLAADELLRKYGKILVPFRAVEYGQQLDFMRIQFFLLSGQAGEAYRALRALGHRCHPYLWHVKMASRSGVGPEHWESVEKTLRMFFRTNRTSKIFALLAYAVVMGDRPARVLDLSKELNFKEDAESVIYQSLCRDYIFLTTRVTPKEKSLFPASLAKQFKATPLIEKSKTLYLGCSRVLSCLQIDEIEMRIARELICIPMKARAVLERNHRLYAR